VVSLYGLETLLIIADLQNRQESCDDGVPGTLLHD
jgi:hypothetical protein